MKQIILPWPPSVNNYWHNRVISPRGYKKPFVSVYVSKEGAEYKKQVAKIAAYNQVKTMYGRLAVSIKIHAPDRRKRDLDNLNKSLLDAMTEAGFWGDDSQIDQLTLERGEVRPGSGCVIIEVDEIESQVQFA